MLGSHFALLFSRRLIGGKNPVFSASIKLLTELTVSLGHLVFSIYFYCLSESAMYSDCRKECLGLHKDQVGHTLSARPVLLWELALGVRRRVEA